MDFQKILHVARKNELNKKEPVKCLQTKFKPPSKEQREKDKVLSEGVQRFLARKEEEERQKQREAERRKQELLALRAKDPKANRRVQTMLKRTKSANKSVMEDAIDTNNTADTLAGPSQPDEDDYGFVSETSSQLYNKLIQKMYSMPSDDQPKFAPTKKPNSSNLSNTKERVKMALLKQEEEEKLPHKRKRKGKDKNEDDDESQLGYAAPDRDLNNVLSGKEKAEQPKPRKPAPPPMDFHQLLKIAEQKQHEPIVFQPKEKKPEEPEVLMTKKQKLEYERMQEWKRKRELGLLNSENKASKDEKGAPKKVLNGKQPLQSQKIPKISNSDDQRTPQKVKNGKITPGKEKVSKPKQVTTDRMDRIPKSDDKKPKADIETSRLLKERDEARRILKEKERLIKERDEAMRLLKEKERIIKERDEAMRRLKEKEQLLRERDEAVRKLKLLEKAEREEKLPGKSGDLNGEKPGRPSAKPDEKVSPTSKPNGKVNLMNKPNGTVSKLDGKDVRIQKKGLPQKDAKSREFPPRDMKPVKRFPPGDVRRKPSPVKRRRIDSDDDEYDSELDDFIDDGDADVGSEDVSKVISEIFRYDKNKYSRYDDDDDECMESNYRQISKEEFFSAKCGFLEDLKDIQREKAMLAKKKQKR